MSRTTSGRVRTRFSLQPSRKAPPKSSAVRLRCWSMVPMAPSSTRMRCDKRSRSTLADSVRLRMGERGHFSLPIAAPLGPIAAKIKGARDGPRPNRGRARPLQVLARYALQTHSCSPSARGGLPGEKPVATSFILPGFPQGAKRVALNGRFWGLNGDFEGVEGNAGTWWKSACHFGWGGGEEVSNNSRTYAVKGLARWYSFPLRWKNRGYETYQLEINGLRTLAAPAGAERI